MKLPGHEILGYYEIYARYSTELNNGSHSASSVDAGMPIRLIITAGSTANGLYVTAEGTMRRFNGFDTVVHEIVRIKENIGDMYIRFNIEIPPTRSYVGQTNPAFIMNRRLIRICMKKVAPLNEGD